ncbi:hypothetical protein GGI23_004597, partial [Coemansia sp. RSA 2559]
MKFYTRVASLALVGVFALVANSLAAPDIAGTKTIVISLATGDNGQIIPIVIDKNRGSVGQSQAESGSAYDEDASSAKYEDASETSDSQSVPDGFDPKEPNVPSDEQTVSNLTTVSKEEQTTAAANDSDSDGDTDDEGNKDTTAANNTTASEESAASSNTHTE